MEIRLVQRTLIFSVSKLPWGLQKKLVEKNFTAFMKSIERQQRNISKISWTKIVINLWLHKSLAQCRCLYAQTFKTSEVCPPFWASLFCIVKKKGTCARAGTYAKHLARTKNGTCKSSITSYCFLKSWSFRAPLK